MGARQHGIVTHLNRPKRRVFPPRRWSCNRMKSFTDEPGGGTSLRAFLGRLFRKYVAMFVAAVCLALVTGGAIDIWFTYYEQKALLVRIQRGEAEFAAARISQFVKEIEGQMAWATLVPWSASMSEVWRFDAVRLLRQVPAITELAQLNAAGRE